MKCSNSTAMGRWIAAATLLVLSAFASPVMAQSCNGFANSLAVDPASQTVNEFDAGNNYGPVTVTLTVKANSLPTGATLVWNQTGGPAVTLNTSNPLRPTFVAPVVGPAGATLGFSVRAHCNGVAAGSGATASVTIVNVDRPPVVTALASPPIADAGGLVTLTATASDPDGDAIAYTWTQTEGTPGVTLSAPSAPSTTFVAPTVPSEVTLQFQVEARSGTLARTATVNVTVTAANLPPFAVLSCPAVVDEGALFRLDGSGSYDPEGAALTYEWFIDQIDSGLDFSLINESGNFVDRIAPNLGLFMTGGVEVRLRVRESATVFSDATCAFMVVDVTAPALDLPRDLLLDAASAAGTQVASYDVSAFDNVDGDLTALVACAPPAPHLFPLGVTPVDCAVEDSAGNGTAGSFNIDVQDLSAPVFDPLNDVSIEGNTLGGGFLTYALPTASDTVDPDVAVSCEPPSESFFAIGSKQVDCTATDDAGNIAKASFQASVHDTRAPVLTLPGNIVDVEATGPGGAAVSFAASALDIVDGDVSVSCTPASASTFGLGTTTVNCSATDAATNTGTGSFTVTVVDTTAPVLTLPDNITGIEATGPGGAQVSFAASAFDIVDGDVPVSCTPASASTFGLGTTTVNCSATDAANNTGTGSFTVTVTDTTPPAFDAYPSVINATAGGNAQATVTFALPTASDLVDGSVTVSCDRNSGDVFPAGATPVTCTAKDSRNNVATLKFTVQVDFAWTGFFRPVDNMPAINVVKAGSAIPVKFSLGGDQGLAIFKAGSPASGAVQCQGTYADEITLSETVNAGGSSLSYDASSGQYIYVWKTEKNWSGCRVLQFTLIDGSVQKALFQFKK